MAEGRVVIRLAGRDDIEVFLRLVDALADYEKLDRPSPEARERLIDDGFGASPRFRAYLGELDGRAVAYAITFHTYSSFLALPTLFIEDIFVVPEARRAGVGTAFFRYLCAEAVREGCGRMEWVVLDWNTLATDFYDRMGSRRMGEWYTYRLNREQLETLAADRA